MPKTSVAGGVCLACKFDPDCAFEAVSSRVVLQCEQFAMECPEPLMREPFFDDNAFQKMLRGEMKKPVPGLCSNCDNREACVYPKPEGGIWRCEEYV